MKTLPSIETDCNSVLDNDAYIFSMQEAVLSKNRGLIVRYEGKNRNPDMKFSPEAVKAIRAEIDAMGDRKATDKEIETFSKAWPFLSPAYLEYLRNYRPNPREVTLEYSDGNLRPIIEGPWHRTIWWEVPVLYTQSKNYFKFMDTDWSMDGQEEKLRAKGVALDVNKCLFSEFGARRRRNFVIEDLAVRTFLPLKHFVGTSNVYLALKYGGVPKGTMAHQWIQAYQYIHGLKHCNQAALTAWNDVFQGNLGTALTDTVGTDAFIADFGPVLARLFDGCRHDSGDPEVFVDKIIANYKRHMIDPLTKMALFSDSLNVDKAIAIARYCLGKIRCAFGIGTFFTNDFGPNSPAMNIVIKLMQVMGYPVVKVPDVAGKEQGDPDMIRVAKYIIRGVPL